MVAVSQAPGGKVCIANAVHSPKNRDVGTGFDQINLLQDMKGIRLQSDEHPVLELTKRRLKMAVTNQPTEISSMCTKLDT